MSRWSACIAALAVSAALAQSPVPSCDAAEFRQLDFWVGDWVLTYSQNGKTTTSRNHVTKILDGCAILEEFDGAPGTTLAGRSMSTFDRPSGKWKQTWVDNSGAYLDFSGGREEGRMVLAREARKGTERVLQRMVYDEIHADSLRWRWERSDDDGRSWKTLWEIAYRRAR